LWFLGEEDNDKSGDMVLATGVASLPRNPRTGSKKPTASSTEVGNFTPVHWYAYFSDSWMTNYVLVTVNVPSGMANLKTDLKFSVSSCGMFLLLKAMWPRSVYHFGDMASPWKGEKGLGNHVYPIMNAAERELSRLWSVSGVAMSAPIVGKSLFKLNFEVERDIVKKVAFVDDLHGAAVQILMREQNKK
jgi:hypothetical protein